MTNETSLETVEQESVQELTQDGFIELNFGVLLLLFFNIIYKPSAPSIFEAWFNLALVIFCMFYIIFAFSFYRGFKKKYVYPRIGYAKLREVHSSKAILGTIVIFILSVTEEITLIYIISIDVVTMDWVYRWIPVFFGLTACTFSFLLKYRTGQNRYYLLGVLMTITGLTAALADFISTDMALTIYFDGWSIAILVLGVIKFLLFIRKYPITNTPEAADCEE